MAQVNLTVNGKAYSVNVPADMPLLWVLRDTLNLTGTKYGCGEGVCGACTVLIDGVAAHACLIPVNTVKGEVITIEGLSADGNHPLQRAWVEVGVSECGYCQPGQIMAAASLLNSNPDPTESEIDKVMSGNLCRCGTYNRIRRAILLAAQEMK